MHLRKIMIAMLVAVATIAAGCSSSSSSDSATADGSGGAKPSGTPVKVGVICSCSGSFGKTIDAAGKVTEAWAKSVNAAGGINGHPVELTKYDDAGNPGTSVTKAQALISAKVDVILDLTPLDAAWGAAAAAAKIPVVGGELNSSLFIKYPNAYASGQTASALPFSVIATAKLAGAKNVGILYCAESPSCQETVPGIKAAGDRQGVPVTYSASISATAANYTAQCVAAKQAHVDALYIAHSASILQNVATDCDRQGYNPSFLEAGTGFQMALADTPGLKDHLWMTFPILPFFVDEPPVQAMNTVVDKYYPGLREGDTWSTFASQAWTGGLLIESAVKASGAGANDELSAEILSKGFTSVKDDNLGGWSAPLTFKAGQTNPVNCSFTARLQDGKALLVDDGKLVCDTSS